MHTTPTPRVPRRSVEAFLGAHESVSAQVETRDVRSPEDEARFAALQTAIGLAMSELPAEPEGGVMWAPENAILSQVQSFMAEQAGAAGALEGDEVKYDDHDLAGWASSFFDWWRKLTRHDFVEATSASVIEIPRDARLALFGDWGSGRYGAPVVASTIAAIKERVDAVIHLGDTYYAGTEKEIASNLEAIWPRRTDSRHFSLNGNHEMYGGGRGYFKAIARFGQPSSYFALRNDDWLIAALDTAYADADLHGNQAQWLEELAASAGRRRILLLTHHQPFSAFEKGGARLVAALERLLGEGRIHAWLWGHEHRLAIYDPHPAWGVRGRCVGHGGYPYFRVTKETGWEAVGDRGDSLWYRFPAAVDRPGGLVLGDENPFVVDDPERYGAHGFATLVLDGRRAVERYCRPDGTVVHEAALGE